MGELREGEEGEWLLNTTPDRRQDVAYVNAIIDSLSESHQIDESRIYAVGYSLGAMYTYEVACQMSDRFAAIASHAGSMPMNQSSCDPERPVSIMHIHGAQDSLIPYNQTWEWKAWDLVGQMYDIPNLVQHWSEQHGCDRQAENATASGTHIVHDACQEGARVEHHRLSGVDHEWPGEIDGVSTHQAIWSFLSEFSNP